MTQFARPVQMFFSLNLRARIALCVGVPILVVMSTLVIFHHFRELKLLEDQLQLSTSQMGEVLMGSLRHAMLINDLEMVNKILTDVGNMENFKDVLLINADGQVVIDTTEQTTDQVKLTSETGCAECHSLPPSERPRAVKLTVAPDVLRIAKPIANEPECDPCHDSSQAHLGMLIADVSLIDVENHLWEDLRSELVFAGLTIVFVTIGIYFLIHQLVVRRLMAFDEPLAQFAEGNLAARLPVSSGSTDEIDRLAMTFNQMAQKLERHNRDQEERGKLRHRAIIEERERIARELHDGLAQLLGYVNTKVMAVRLWLKQGNSAKAEELLCQIEEAARALFVETREAILGLRMNGQNGANLSAMVKDYTVQFSNLTGVPVFFVHDPAVDEVRIPAEAELQLLRIIQEALTNVRKHADATKTHINMWMEDDVLELAIVDDGHGFDLDSPNADHNPHFGLAIMRERAQSIDAEFNLNSSPETGTEINIQLKIEES
jgi:signal transduction histidine kinase